MALDLREGDTLVVGNKEYPIKSCAEWAWRYGAGIDRLVTVAASTKRPPAVVAGKRGAPTTLLASVKCTPLDPVDPEIQQRLALETPHELLETYVNGGDTFYHLVVEELKR